MGMCIGDVSMLKRYRHFKKLECNKKLRSHRARSVLLKSVGVGNAELRPLDCR